MGRWFYIPGLVPYDVGVQRAANGTFFTNDTMAVGMWTNEVDRRFAAQTGGLVQLYGWDAQGQSWRILRQLRPQSLGRSWGA